MSKEGFGDCAVEGTTLRVPQSHDRSPERKALSILFKASYISYHKIDTRTPCTPCTPSTRGIVSPPCTVDAYAALCAAFCSFMFGRRIRCRVLLYIRGMCSWHQRRYRPIGAGKATLDRCRGQGENAGGCSRPVGIAQV